jgi:hypothetical protein
MIQHTRVRRVRWAVAGLALIALAFGCSAGDPPNPDAARSATTARADGPPGASDEPSTSPTDTPDAEGDEPAEEATSDADDATLDALEEQYERLGVKDIRGAPGQGVTIRLEDELTVDHAAPVCTAVRSAGFADVTIDIGGTVTPCP